jgi:CHAT domain-containing protein
VTEALAVAEMLSAPFGGHVYLAHGDGATEPLVRLQMSGKRFVHMATHGFWDGSPDCRESMIRSELAGVEEVFLTLDPPLYDFTRLSALVVAGANAQSKDPADDGFISGAEIAELDLSQAELVVLSACETGLGFDSPGEGALGLTRGFVMAGAQNVIAALWRVPSVATSALFRDTYAALTRKKSPLPPAAALREAKLAALARARAQGAPASALMWGAFVLLSARGAKR